MTRAIIIEDKDAKALLKDLELTKLKEPDAMFRKDMYWADMHRTFHYVVCKWLQDQGCDVTG